jgi:hypothetical protein
MYVLRCLLGIPLNMKMQLSPLGLEMQLTSYIYSWVHHWNVTLGLSMEMWLHNYISSWVHGWTVLSRPGPESQARNAVVQLHFHPKAKYQTRNAVAQLHFQDQGSVSNRKCGCATAFLDPRQKKSSANLPARRVMDTSFP